MNLPNVFKMIRLAMAPCLRRGQRRLRSIYLWLNYNAERVRQICFALFALTVLTPFASCGNSSQRSNPVVGYYEGNSMKRIVLFAVATAALSISGCTSTTKVSAIQPGDQKMSCSQIENEFVRLDSVMEEADDNKGVNTANVAAVLLFWPAAVGNYLDADKAQDLVDKRKTHLMGIYNKKGCDEVEEASS